MLNFGGQTRRRVVNLGSRNRPTTKNDILKRSEQERELRANNRRNEGAARTIQRSLRKRLDLKRYFNSPTYQNLNSRQSLSLVIVFKSRLLDYGIPEAQLRNILSNLKEYSQSFQGTVANSALINLLNHYHNDNLLIETLRALNIEKQYFDIDTFVGKGIIPFLDNIKPNGLLPDSANALCQLLFSQRTERSDSWLINLLQNVEPEYNLFQCIVTYNLFPENFQSFINGNNLLNNLCYIDSNIPHDTSEPLTAMILDVIQNLNETEFQFMPYSEHIVEKTFIERILKFTTREQSSLQSYPPIKIIDILLKISKNVEVKNNILMILLAKQSFNTLLYEGLSKLNQKINNVNDMPPEYRISRELTRLYLQFATDADLLSQTQTSYLSLPLLQLLTHILKKVTFNTLWNGRSSGTFGKKEPLTDPTIEIKEELSLLTQLYLRDSSGLFLSGDVKDFWCVTEESFINVNLYPILVQYEELYQKEMNIGISSDIYEKRNDILNKLLKEKYHGVMSRPFRKLSILIKSPFFIPFNQRVDYFYFLIETDKHAMGYDNIMSWLTPDTFGDTASMPMVTGRRSATISREHVLEDAMDAYNYGSDLKAKLSVTFVNEFGREEGIDGGGVTKEFLTSVIEEGFKSDSEFNSFTTNEAHELYPKATTNQEYLKVIMFLGKIVGKCLYDHILVDLTFANFFLKTLLIGVDHLTIDDLRSFDPTLYDNLIKLLKLSDEELIALDLTFETMNMFYPDRVIELIPHGSDIKVNKQNVLQYVWRLSQYKLRSISKPASYRFLEGLSSIIPQHWFGMFNTVDYQMLISGGHKPIDINDLKTNTEYGGFENDDQTIKYFWEVLEEFSDEEKREFLKFVTSVPQAPLKGFSALEPKFGIRNGGDYELNRLPTASTCVNLLKLPDYANKTVLREKLLYAITSGARFDLS